MSENKPTGAGAAQAAGGKRPVPPALRPLLFMGIPESVLTWKPRMPSRNMSIFILTVGALTIAYYEDRQECKRIRSEYVERVRGLAEQPMRPSEWPRKVSVYTAKYPGNDDWEVAAIYFRRYVKPILNAAAVDWEIVSGTRHGGLARELRDRFQERRRHLAGVQPWPNEAQAAGAPPNPFQLRPAQMLQREIDGGVVIVGRPSLKEWAWAMQQGWGTSIPRSAADRDEQLASQLSDDGAFDEVPSEPRAHDGDGEDTSTTTPDAPSGNKMLPTQVGLRSLQGATMPFAPAKTATPEQERPPAAQEPDLEAPEQIPAQPPLCFVDYTDLVGFSNIPRRMWRFFNRREDVRRGGEAALSIILGDKSSAREFQAGAPGGVPRDPPQGGDLDWGLHEEEFYRKSFNSTRANVAKEREKYYEELPARLRTARELARREREPTKQEERDPPKSESELISERFEKERDWRNLEEGFDIVNRDAGVTWEERWRGSLRVFTPRRPDEAVPHVDHGNRGADPRRSAAENAAQAAASASADEVAAPLAAPGAV